MKCTSALFLFDPTGLFFGQKPGENEKTLPTSTENEVGNAFCSPKATQHTRAEAIPQGDIDKRRKMCYNIYQLPDKQRESPRRSFRFGLHRLDFIQFRPFRYDLPDRAGQVQGEFSTTKPAGTTTHPQKRLIARSIFD